MIDQSQNLILSVVVPVYNGAEHIQGLISTFQKQEFESMEVIFVDDGSKDQTLEICTTYAKTYPWIHVLHTENKGVSHARNLGIQAANGKWIQFVDVDDTLYEGAFHGFYDRVSKDMTDLAICGCTRIEHDKEEVFCGPEKDELAEGSAFYQLFDRLPMERRYWLLDYTWNKWYRREIIEQYQVRYPEELSLGEDFVFNTQYLQHITKVSLLRGPYYRYQVGPYGLVSRFQEKPWELQEAWYQAQRALYQELQLLSTNEDWLKCQAGRIAFGFIRSVNWAKCPYTQKEKLHYIERMIRDVQFSYILQYLQSRKSPVFRFYYRVFSTRHAARIFRLIRLEKMFSK